jgi:hypothetical protein
MMTGLLIPRECFKPWVVKKQIFHGFPQLARWSGLESSPFLQQIKFPQQALNYSRDFDIGVMIRKQRSPILPLLQNFRTTKTFGSGRD